MPNFYQLNLSKINLNKMRRTPVFLEEKTISLETFKKDSKLKAMTTGDVKQFKRQLMSQKEIVRKE